MTTRPIARALQLANAIRKNAMTPRCDRETYLRHEPRLRELWRDAELESNEVLDLVCSMFGYARPAH